MTDAKYKAVDGGFECVCGLVFETPLGISRHRAMCSAYNGGESA